MIAPASLAWFARHELRLAWRDAAAMLQGGRRRWGGWAVVAILVVTVVLHLVAYAVLQSSADVLTHPDKAFFVAYTGSAFLAWALLVSQALETATRSFYARADLDLILSSPAMAAKVFAIRIGAIALATVAMSGLLLGPVIDVMAILGGARRLLAYGVLVAMGLSAAAVAVSSAALLFRFVGPKRTRLLAQIVAAVVGAGFVIGIQAAAVLSYGSLSRTQIFRSPELVAAAPDVGHPIYWPARASLGDGAPLAILLGLAAAMLLATIVAVAPAFARNAIAVAGLSRDVEVARGRRPAFRARSQRHVLRWKEWTLLQRDPWLLSQSLMQVLYLLPPALLLWRNYGSGSGSLAVLAPVVVMAAGQLAGGLAWLAISGEDGPDLVATAPVVGTAVLRAKIEAVMIAVALLVAPIVIGMAFAAPLVAGVTLFGVGFAAAGASAVQLCFKSQAKRSHFRRRQTSSRLATFAEAFLSIAIAAAAGLAAAGLWSFVCVPAVFAGLVLLLAWIVTRPPRPREQAVATIPARAA